MDTSITGVQTRSSENRIVRAAYVFIVFLAALTGFGQMPIYKRYYMSDIPGFGWLANFWTTRFVHYAAAALLLGLIAYVAFDYFAVNRLRRRITASGYLRIALLAGIVVSGVLFVLKNFPVFLFSPQFIIFLNLSHLGLVMMFLVVSLYCLVFKKQWTRPL